MAGINSLYMNVYNTYLTTYNTKSLTRYDTHKKSELRGIYNAIVKLNKESPLYKVNFSRETQEYAVELKEGARGLKNVINDLTNGNTEEIFNKKTMFSENDQVVTAKYIGDDLKNDSQIDDFQVEVHSLAEPQVNEGRYLPKGERLLETGIYAFNIEVNGQDYEFQFGVADGDNNMEVQNKLKRLINNSNIGLKAEVNTTDTASALQITSKDTGSRGRDGLIFHVTDIPPDSYGVVSRFALDNVNVYPKDSSFAINGVERNTHSNTFVAGKAFEITLHGISAANNPSVIGFKTDTEAITEHIETFVSEYNSFLDTVRGYSDLQPRSEKLIREYTNIARQYMNDLESIGLEIMSDGNIHIDAGLLTEATKDEENYNETLQGINGFKNAVLRKANQSLLDPMEYVDKVMLNYKNPGRNYVNPYVTSIYSGMMFNSYC
ncbi:MAG: flagellar filament capping protein FliD [Lachnospiraceae bacterium]|nr:flagellar filament capping protein FliD [Lachnospiraceae bacterium]